MSISLKAQLAAARDSLFPRNSPGCYGKKRYQTKHLAEMAQRTQQQHDAVQLFVYHCGSCDGWHLTKTPRR